jgi:uncharacterized membrane protein
MNMVNASDVPPGYQIHWHVFLTHFPLSFISVALLFQLFHLNAYPECFELASTVTLVLGVVALVPTTATGYFTWKTQYHAAHVPIFRRKVMISLALLSVGLPLCVWRILIGKSTESTLPQIHWPYFFGTALMCIGAILEGYYGGRLSHRPRVQFHRDAG